MVMKADWWLLGTGVGGNNLKCALGNLGDDGILTVKTVTPACVFVKTHQMLYFQCGHYYAVS